MRSAWRCWPLAPGRLSYQLPRRKLLTDIGRMNRDRCCAQPFREVLPAEEQRLPAFFDKRLPLAETLLHHLDPARPVAPALPRNAGEVCHPFAGRKIVRKLGGEAMKSLLARDQTAPRTVEVGGVPSRLAGFVRRRARFLKQSADCQ